MPTLTDAAIIPFRHPNRFGQTDAMELIRWSATAAQALWFLQDDLDPVPRHSRWIACTEDGDEYISVTFGSSEAPLEFMVAPLNGRWQLFDHSGLLLRTFFSLRDALETICPTLSQADFARSRSVA